MKVQFYFKDVKQVNKMYCVQGKIIRDPLFFYSQNQLAILCFIISDVNNNSIECVAFGKEAKHLKQKIEINKLYQINYVSAVNNNKYIKTNHRFKLLLTQDSTILNQKIQKYSKGRKICVNLNSNKNKIDKNHQLSIMNWLKKK